MLLAKGSPAPAEAQIEIAGTWLTADVAGALAWAEESLLVVADLHLEKGSSWARRGMMLPPWDTASTLERLAEALARRRPRTVIALGDSFHDPGGGERMTAPDRRLLEALQSGRDWIWVTGNHDPQPLGLGGDYVEEVALGRLRFRHEPRPGASPGEIAGHLHPVARVTTRRGSARRRCFVSDATRCVMPAFGAYAGGLNLRDRAYDPLFAADRRVHVLGRRAVFAVAERFCAGE